MTTLEMTGYDAADLSDAFDSVKAKTHWKDPIDAIIMAERRDIVEAAIKFYTTTVPRFTTHYDATTAGLLRVRSVGYRAGPAGDH